MHDYDILLDYDEIQKDQRRMEHFKTLIMLLKIFFDEEENLSEDEILEYFGKVMFSFFVSIHFFIPRFIGDVDSFL